MRFYWLVLCVLAAVHTWDTIPVNWETLGPPLAGTTIDLRISLKPHRQNALIDSLYEVSTPNHSKLRLRHSCCTRIYSREPLFPCRYGAHLSQEQVADLVAPHPDTLKLVRSWLEHHGVPPSSFSMTHTGNWLKVTGVPVYRANELLGASYELYRHAETNETILCTISYALPAELEAHVQTVVPTTYFGWSRTLRKTPRMRPGRAAAAGAPRGVTSRDDDDDEEDDYIRPSYLRRLYNSETYVPRATDQNVLGVTGYLGEYPSPTDLRLFMQKYRTDGLSAEYYVAPINGGGYYPNSPGNEANLNIQYTQGMTFPTPHVFYSTGGSPPFMPDSRAPINTNEPFLDWLEYVLRHRNIPQTISNSYSESEQTVPLDYAKSVCDLFGQLGLRGVSFLTSSGNVGVGAGTCMTNDGSGKVQFLPRFPSSCTCGALYTGAGVSRSPHRHGFTGPWVTSVGGAENPSNVYPVTGDLFPEIAESLSSGGFSNYFQVPDYQKNEVSTFIRNLDKQYEGLYKYVRCRDLT
jgi:tripeptidyl-peptidase-1